MKHPIGFTIHSQKDRSGSNENEVRKDGGIKTSGGAGWTFAVVDEGDGLQVVVRPGTFRVVKNLAMVLASDYQLRAMLDDSLRIAKIMAAAADEETEAAKA
jgi:hypothetical protein